MVGTLYSALPSRFAPSSSPPSPLRSAAGLTGAKCSAPIRNAHQRRVAGVLSRITFDPAPRMRPRWSADGRLVTFICVRPGALQHRADGLGGDSSLKAGVVDEANLSPDGAWLVLRTGSNGSVAGGSGRRHDVSAPDCRFTDHDRSAGDTRSHRRQSVEGRIHILHGVGCRCRRSLHHGAPAGTKGTATSVVIAENWLTELRARMKR